MLYTRSRIALRRAALLVQVILLLSAALLPFQGLPALAAAPAAALDDAAELEAFIDGWMGAELKTNNIPGAVVTVVKDGEIFFAKGYGYANLEASQPVDPARTLFRPGSVSKLFTWTAVMQLVEQGEISLDADINAYLDIEIPDTFSEPITMRHLMTHTPGFEDVGEDLFVLEAEKMPTLRDYLIKIKPQRVFPPGELGAYSNYGTALAGYIVQSVSGMPFEEYVDLYILDPLGMENSTFRQPLPDGLAADMSGGYNYVGGAYNQGGFEYIGASPAGGLSATGMDMARFMIAHLQNGEYQGGRILRAETARQMHEPVFSHHPDLGGMAHGFFTDEMNGRRIISHGGDTILFHSGLFLILEENVGVFVSTNGTTGSSTGSGLIGAFMDRYFPVEEPAAPQPPADFAGRIQPYLGEYSLARSNFSSFEKIISLFSTAQASLTPDGYLLVNIMGEVRQFVEVEPGLLQDRLEPDSRLAYRMDDSGQAYLLPNIPFAFIKAPWYATSAFHGLLLVVSLVLFLGALIGWPAKALTAPRFRKKQVRQPPQGYVPPPPRLARVARITAALLSLLLLVFVVMFVSLLGNVLPEYGVPGIFFGQDGGLESMLLLPYGMAFLAVVMLVFTVLAWVKRWWSTRGRIFYSLLTLFALVLLWQMAFWNLWL